MPPHISFPGYVPSPEWRRESLSFPALVDGRPVRVLVTAEALMSRFGARGPQQQELERAFVLNSSALREIARSFIEAGRISPEGEVLITNKNLMQVTIGPKLLQWGEGEVLARQVTRLLEEVVGPAAPKLSAEWDRGEDERGRVVFTLRLSYGDVSVTARFEPWELADERHLRVRFIRLWGDLLQDRSHLLLNELQEPGGRPGE